MISYILDVHIWLRTTHSTDDKPAGDENESKFKCHVISRDVKQSSTGCTRKAKPVCMMEKSAIYPSQIIPEFEFASQLEACKNGNDTETTNPPSRIKRDGKEANTITTGSNYEIYFL